MYFVLISYVACCVSFVRRCCSVAAYVVSSEPHTGARPSVRLRMGPELARCDHRRLALYADTLALFFVLSLSRFAPREATVLLLVKPPKQKIWRPFSKSSPTEL